MKKKMRTKLGQYVVMSGLVRLRDVNRCMLEQKRLRERGERHALGRLLVREKLLTEEQLREALAAIGALVAYCPRCRQRGKVKTYRPGKNANCPRCRAMLLYEDATALSPSVGTEQPIRPPDPNAKDTTFTSDPKKDPLINRIIGGCQILQRIARGGMGVVYKAKQLNLGRTVAVKILAEELANDTTFVRRFINEARAAAELSHGNIVHINDVGQFEGIFYFSMEYVDGANLSQILRKRNRLDTLKAAEIAYQVCLALRHAHRKDIIHRDIKPENIMITADGVVKLADLGLAKNIREGEAALTQAGAVMGTPYYMAPEQARDFSNVDNRSDIYSLGATIYRAVGGRVPFEGRTPLEVMIKACSGRKTTLRELRPDVPKEFEALVDRMMRADPHDRFQDVQEVIDALGALIPRLSLTRQS